jgi:hypothetical protein
MARIVNGRLERDARPGLGAAQPLIRKVSAVAMIIAFYTSLYEHGFSPLGDGVAPVAGAYMVDRVVAPIVLLGAFIAQWQIAAHRGGDRPVLLPYLTDETGWYYTSADYWGCYAGEAAALAVARYAFDNRGLGLVLIGLVCAGLWLLGWQLTPYHRRREVWDVVKGFLVLEMFAEARRLVRR